MLRRLMTQIHTFIDSVQQNIEDDDRGHSDSSEESGDDDVVPPRGPGPKMPMKSEGIDAKKKRTMILKRLLHRWRKVSRL